MLVKDEGVLEEFRSRKRCDWCGGGPSFDLPLVPHHIRCRGHGGGSRLDIRENLLTVCWRCHAWIQEHIPADAQFAVVAAREGTTVQKIRNKINRLLRTRPPEYTPTTAASLVTALQTSWEADDCQNPAGSS